MNTQPSLIFDTVILENGIIKIPELKNWQKQDIHVIIVFKQNIQSKDTKIVNLAGSLKKYANPDLIERETDIAWSKVKDS